MLKTSTNRPMGAIDVNDFEDDGDKLVLWPRTMRTCCHCKQRQVGNAVAV